ncbi:glycogen synthase GlgA [Marinobacter sp. F4218]|uniref:glycogen synthase GlgA n=1 Tax=Marinobacter sp. F4218 TaxID=2862868 RepID=UPI001C62DA3C|nr:glycogen synthase GlgA [Marinobacter sp. F4218]MBW7469868.1 glycogen synthase GlgA [Marinobacter sp. F4218]
MTRVLFATSEVYPLVKTGGLADVSASLPEALCRLGYDVNILLPGYPSAMAAASRTGTSPLAQFSIDGFKVTLVESRLPGTAVTIWLVDCPQLFGREGNPYQNDQGEDWPDNAQRFKLFAEVGARIAMGQAGLAWCPEIVHCNDWQSALLPVFLQAYPERPGTVFTIHNLAYQGLFPQTTFAALGLPETLWRYDQLEFHGQLSFIKGGLVFSDRITTVSPGYAEEIQTPELGYGLDGLLRYRRPQLSGILNGIDTRTWNPEDDQYLDRHYGRDHLKNKRLCQTALLQTMGLAANGAALLGFIGRLVEQKGLDWLLSVMPPLLERGCQFAILGSGEARFEAPLKELARKWPAHVSLKIGYDEALAHRITAGCDLFLMPSRFEPCGLNQMYSLRYGTIPVVHAVGGLRDTVFDPADTGIDHANGFCFKSPDPVSFLEAVERALDCHKNRKAWRRLQENGMAGDYSWTQSAVHYGELYQGILAERQTPIKT